MRVIGVDARVLRYSHKSGVEEYAEKIIENMVYLDPSVKFKLFFSGWSQEDIKPRPWFYRDNVEIVFLKTPNRVLSVLSFFFDWPKINNLLGVDIFFSPHVLLASLTKDCRRVTTFHDLSFERFPEFFSFKRRLWHGFQRISADHAKLSNHIIAVSDSTKRDIISLYGVDPVKISVVYSGVDDSFVKPSQKELDNFRVRNNVPDKFFLFLGTIEPRKNVDGIIKAFSKLSEENQHHLVIAGKKGWLYDQVFKEAKKSKYRDRVIFLDYIENEDRRYWLSLSEALLYPSFLEGFGFPLLEAMRCETAIITSRNSSMAEIVGSAGILVNPHDIDEISKAMEIVALNPKLRKDLVISGINRSKEFSWQKAAEKTLSILLEE